MVNRRDTISAYGLGIVPCALAVFAALRSTGLTSRSAATLVLLAVLYAVAFRTEFVSSAGSTVPTQPVLVAMLFLLPIGWVPIAVLSGLLLAAVTAGSLATQPARRSAIAAISAWHCFGPVAVLAWANLGHPALSDWLILVTALGAQLAIDAVTGALRCSARGIGISEFARPMAWTATIDTLLSPIGLCAVIAANGSAWTILLAAAPVALVGLLAKDRQLQLQRSEQLGGVAATAQMEARIDAMTGLANLRAWREALDAADLAAASNETEFIVMVADLDHLKLANDTYGHESGDALIRGFARVLLELPVNDHVAARVGGDEFAVLVRAAPGEHTPDDLVADIKRRVGNLAPIGEVRLSASIGAALGPPHNSLADAYRSADKAAFADKTRRRASRRVADVSQ